MAFLLFVATGVATASHATAYVYVDTTVVDGIEYRRGDVDIDANLSFDGDPSSLLAAKQCLTGAARIFASATLNEIRIKRITITDDPARSGTSSIIMSDFPEQHVGSIRGVAFDASNQRYVIDRLSSATAFGTLKEPLHCGEKLAHALGHLITGLLDHADEDGSCLMSGSVDRPRLCEHTTHLGLSCRDQLAARFPLIAPNKELVGKPSDPVFVDLTRFSGGRGNVVLLLNESASMADAFLRAEIPTCDRGSGGGCVPSKIAIVDDMISLSEPGWKSEFAPQVGVLTFNDDVRLLAPVRPIGPDFGTQLKSMMSRLRPLGGKSAFLRSLELSIELFRDRATASSKRIALISDRLSATDTGWSKPATQTWANLADAAAALANRGIEIKPVWVESPSEDAFAADSTMVDERAAFARIERRIGAATSALAAGLAEIVGLKVNVASVSFRSDPRAAVSDERLANASDWLKNYGSNPIDPARKTWLTFPVLPSTKSLWVVVKATPRPSPSTFKLTGNGTSFDLVMPANGLLSQRIDLATSAADGPSSDFTLSTPDGYEGQGAITISAETLTPDIRASLVRATPIVDGQVELSVDTQLGSPGPGDEKLGVTVLDGHGNKVPVEMIWDERAQRLRVRFSYPWLESFKLSAILERSQLVVVPSNGAWRLQMQPRSVSTQVFDLDR